MEKNARQNRRFPVVWFWLGSEAGKARAGRVFVHQTSFLPSFPSLNWLHAPWVLHSALTTRTSFHFTIITGGGWGVLLASNLDHTTAVIPQTILLYILRYNLYILPIVSCVYFLSRNCVNHGNPANVISTASRQSQCSTCLHRSCIFVREGALSLCRDGFRPQKCVFLPIHHHQISSTTAAEAEE